jgi:hypothetical protein
MDIKISIDASGINKAQSWLTQLQGQMPYAASRALNDSAKQAATALNQSTNQYFDRPTRFTQSGYRVSSFSNKKNLEAELRPKPIQERYLLPSITGGIRPQRPSDRRLGGTAQAWRPGMDARLNASGNLPKAALIKALQGGGPYFRLNEKRGKLMPGIYRRVGSGRQSRFKVESVLSFGRLPNIPKRWPIDRITQDSIARTWGPGLNRYMSEAMRTAK